jgi:hypothetical protein
VDCEAAAASRLKEISYWDQYGAFHAVGCACACMCRFWGRGSTRYRHVTMLCAEVDVLCADAAAACLCALALPLVAPMNERED